MNLSPEEVFSNRMLGISPPENTSVSPKVFAPEVGTGIDLVLDTLEAQGFIEESDKYFLKTRILDGDPYYKLARLLTLVIPPAHKSLVQIALPREW
jgi:hypothetical protein